MIIQGFPLEGYMRINTTTPSYNLDMNGNVRCSGNINDVKTF